MKYVLVELCFFFFGTVGICKFCR